MLWDTFKYIFEKIPLTITYLENISMFLKILTFSYSERQTDILIRLNSPYTVRTNLKILQKL